MKYSTTTTLLLALSGVAIASAAGLDDEDDNFNYVSSVCMPRNSTDDPDLNAPCNAMRAIQIQCVYGPEYLIQSQEANSNLRRRQLRPRRSDDDGPTVQSNVTQQLCVCESQFWDQTRGCEDCYRAHGAGSDYELPADALASLSTSYCAASNTPTLGLTDILFDFGNSLETNATSTAATSRFSDPIGNKTEVSLYFTPSVTGTAAWQIPEQTGSRTSANTKDGQIQPTASANNHATGGSHSMGSRNVGLKMEVVVAIASFIGFAGLVMLL